MFEFKETLILTGIENRISNSGRKYTIANFLGENGRTFSCVVDCPVPEGLKQLDKVEVDFKFVPGRYAHVRIIGIKKVE